MPMVPREWWVWTCTNCSSVVNVSPPTAPLFSQCTARCPWCGLIPNGASRRAAIDDPAVGLIGSTETAGLDYLASIANSLVDIRNMLMADHHAVRPMDPIGSDDTQITLPGMIPERERGG